MNVIVVLLVLLAALIGYSLVAYSLLNRWVVLTTILWFAVAIYGVLG